MKKQLYIFSFILMTCNFMMGSSLGFINAQHEPKEDIIAFNPSDNFDITNELSIFDAADQKSKWLFMEKKFITDLHKAKQSYWKIASNIIMTIGVAGAGYGAYNASNDQLDLKDSIKKLITSQNIYKLGAGLGTTALGAQYLESFFTARANKTALTNFFTNWDVNKSLVPTELYPFFDMLARNIQIKGQPFISKNADEIIKAIQFIVTRHFETRYKKILEFEAQNSLSEAKTISEVLKNFIGGAKDLSAL